MQIDFTKLQLQYQMYKEGIDEAIHAIQHNLKVIINSVQSFGATCKGKTNSNLGDISTITSFPLAKPLGCFGDGSTVFTNDDAFAQYSVRVQNRDEVQAKLKEQGIPTAVHYPMSLHLQECFAYLGYTLDDFQISEIVSNEVMSIPMNPYLTAKENQYIYEVLN